ncbi:MAG: ABC transporter permease [Actinomycetota bacterium]|nr:ABC transporter permease [Actinomycetota bacterium]
MLLRYPGLFASLAAGALLLALVASSYPMFISAASSVALGKQIDRTTRFGAGLSLGRTFPIGGADVEAEQTILQERTDLFRRRVARQPHLAEPVVTVMAQIPYEVRSVENPALDSDNLLVARSGAVQHLEVLEGSEGDGMWISHFTADNLNLEPGDEMIIAPPFGGNDVKVRIDGIYRALSTEPRTPFWRLLVGQIYAPGPPGFSTPPPPLMLADLDGISGIVRQMDLRDRPDDESFDLQQDAPLDAARYIWEAPVSLRDPMTLEEARDLQTFMMNLNDALRDRGSELFNAFGCVRCFSNDPQILTQMSGVLSETEVRLAPIEGPVQLLLTAGLLVALTIIAAAGAFAVATRRTESALLFARGMTPLSLGIKACLEATIPVLLGTAAGYGLAALLVRALGPGGVVDPSAVSLGARYAALLVPVALLLVGVVSAIFFSRQSEAASARLGLLARVPWPALMLVASLFFLNQLMRGPGVAEGSVDGASGPSISLLLFPIFFVAGAAGISAGLFQSGFRRLRAGSGKLGSSLFLLIHRLAGAARLSIGLLSACALALGIFVFAQTMVNSLETTIRAKSLLFVGGDVQGTSRLGQTLPDDFPFPSTAVTRLPAEGAILPGEAVVDVLAVDSETVAAVAYWDESFGSAPLQELVGRLPDAEDGQLPVLSTAPEVTSDASLSIDGQAVPVKVVGEVDAFPGMSLDRPVIVVDSATITEVFEQADAGDPLGHRNAASEIWIKGDTDGIVDGLAEVEDPPYFVLTAEEVRDIPSLSAVIDTYGVLQTLGLGAGLLVVVVMLMYMQARQRNRVVSFALSRRMGLGDRSHRASLMLELGVIFTASYAVALLFGLIAARVVVSNVDPLPNIPPDPLFEPPLIPFLLAAAVLGVVSIIGGALANRRAERADLAEVMRLAA